MSEYSFVYDLLVSGAASVLTSGGLAWMVKTWLFERLRKSINHEYDEKLERYKIQTKAAFDENIERLKTDLQMVAAERGVKFSGVFERRLVALEKISVQLWRVRDAVKRYVKTCEENKPNHADFDRDIMFNAYSDFLAGYLSSRIYLHEETCGLINSVKSELDSVIEIIKQMRCVGSGSDVLKTDAFLRAREILDNKVEPLLERLESDFRRLLGVYDGVKV